MEYMNKVVNKLFFGIFFVLFIVNSHAMEENKPQKNVFVELDDVLFIPHPANFLVEKLCGGLIEQEEEKFFNILAKNDKDYPETQVSYYHEKQMPALWRKYLLGELDHKKTYDQANAIIAQHAGYVERYAFYQATKISFNPTQEVGIMKPNLPVIELLNTLKNSCNFFIFSNKHQETIDEFEKKFPEVFKLFGKNIIISGQTRKLKPTEASFDYLTQALNFNASDCYIIDNQKVVVDKAQEKKLNAICYFHKNENAITALKDFLLR